MPTQTTIAAWASRRAQCASCHPRQRLRAPWGSLLGLSQHAQSPHCCSAAEATQLFSFDGYDDLAHFFVNKRWGGTHYKQLPCRESFLPPRVLEFCVSRTATLAKARSPQSDVATYVAVEGRPLVMMSRCEQRCVALLTPRTDDRGKENSRSITIIITYHHASSTPTVTRLSSVKSEETFKN
eukprot:scaffold348213_cov50-Prasinocladus_malaysianus.AAC.1